ncbi:peptidase, partial [Bacillus cereus]|nr:peptidase [Bacillus cereus]
RLDKLVFWMGTTVVGSLIAGGIALLFKFVGK